MRTYEEMIPDFASVDAIGKEKWINNLPLEEMRIFREGLNNLIYPANQSWFGYWISYIDVAISDRVSGIRADKLKELGI